MSVTATLENIGRILSLTEDIRSKINRLTSIVTNVRTQAITHRLSVETMARTVRLGVPVRVPSEYIKMLVEVLAHLENAESELDKALSKLANVEYRMKLLTSALYEEMYIGGRG